MAEVILGLSVASSVAQLIQFSQKIVSQLRELRAGDVPAAFLDIRMRLPLILNIISRIHDAQLSPGDKETFTIVVERSLKQVHQLTVILDKLTIAKGDSALRKGLKVAFGLVEESRIQNIASSLKDNVQLLTCINIAPAEKEKPLPAERRSSEAPPLYGDSTGVFSVPFIRDSQFVGREKVIRSIDEAFEKQTRVAVAGIGGVGKSQVAIEYCYQFKDNDPSAHVFWVYGGNFARFYQGYRRIAQTVALPGWDDPETNILDLVSTMSKEEATKLFLSKVDGDPHDYDKKEIDNLLHELDYLPLAISQAAAFIEENGISISEYLEALRGDDAEEFLHEELNDSRRDEQSINSYYEAKSEDDIRAATVTLKKAIANAHYPSLHYAESAFELAHLYYDQRNEKESLAMGKASFECWKEMEGTRSIRTLDNMEDYAVELAMFGHVDEAISHWQKIIDLSPSTDASENTKTIYMYRSSASISEFQGDASMAEILYKKLIELGEELYNPEHVHVLEYRLCHAEQVMRQGRLQEAIDLAKAILGVCKNQSGWQITASGLQLIAECNRLKGDFAHAKTYHYRLLELLTNMLGRGHQETVDALEAYAALDLDGYDHTSARKMLSHALEQQGKIDEALEF
ncbi:hypothetical protein M7I_6353 [Glarea lozoyensis 74030]|uniref:NACHT-NTPase and P-loop NTPases N-terminal domain-containing protein n=1 Tax=Glarea lozoyensis (strain ATCC 74030 / MF5533) TaxID=1104152 RepID=H0EUC0_GLAL7|nr:hypothetical protein M7I_6353 [Glarea lozoyensis 74030]